MGQLLKNWQENCKDTRWGMRPGPSSINPPNQRHVYRLHTNIEYEQVISDRRNPFFFLARAASNQPTPPSRYPGGASSHDSTSSWPRVTFRSCEELLRRQGPTCNNPLITIHSSTASAGQQEGRRQTCGEWERQGKSSKWEGPASPYEHISELARNLSSVR